MKFNILYLDSIFQNSLFSSQGPQVQVTRYSLTIKARITQLISMSDTYRYFWIRETWSLITRPWASRLVTYVEITNNVCSIFTPLERSASGRLLSRRWNRSLQLSMKRRQEVSRPSGLVWKLYDRPRRDSKKVRFPQMLHIAVRYKKKKLKKKDRTEHKKVNTYRFKHGAKERVCMGSYCIL